MWPEAYIIIEAVSFRRIATVSYSWNTHTHRHTKSALLYPS